MTALNITANGTGLINNTELHVGNAHLFVSYSSTFGGGTLTISIRPLGSTEAIESIDTLIAGAQAVYSIGGMMEVHYTLAGATAPDITMFFSQSL